MKICIVIQSDAFRDSAGMRIRYDRFRECLDPQVATIDAATVAQLAASKTFDHDVYVFCKTFDMAALLLARRIKLARKIVGQDLFDDYFSQNADPRLQRYRDWLRDMAPVTDFAICSTPRMAEVVAPYLPGVRVSVIEDPIVGFDAGRVAAIAADKVEVARDSRALKILWFGIGDNPLFPVGLTDLAACEAELSQMERLGWSVHLRIVTNRRAFEGTGAEALRRLSTPFELVEWTEQSERTALSDATIAIIPVNGQSFSRAKSLNRAITALDGGCQVLSIGFPLYERLSPLIYRSTEELLADVAAGRARLRAETTSTLAERLAQLADPLAAATAFVGEAERATKAGRPSQRPPTCVLHGRASTIGVHKAAGAIGGFSVKTIFCNASWNFPVRFDQDGPGIVMRVTTQLAQKFELAIREGATPKRIGDFDLIDIDHQQLGLTSPVLARGPAANPLLDLAIYEDVMRFAQEACTAAFNGADVIVSDASPFARKPLRTRLPAKPPKRRKPEAKTPAPAMPRSRDRRWHPLTALRRPSTAQRKAAQRRLLEQSPLFDASWYLSRYPDVAASGQDPIAHYLDFGWREGRNPSPAFSTRKYLKANQDVAARQLNPLLHYIEFGQVEGRTAPPAEKSVSAQ